MVVEPLGIGPESVDHKLHEAIWREAINKMCWAIGTLYRVPYSATNSPARSAGVELARLLFKTYGYPARMKKLEP